MDRSASLRAIESESLWDIAIIGGGASGLGIAVDAATRGYRTLLLEQHDFAKSTSSRSTKLIHGGVRYLQQGNVALVRESLHERGNLLRNAPHLVKPLGFVIPCYQWWEKSYYRVGMKAYDLLAGKLGIANSQGLSREETLRRTPTLNDKNLNGGVLYFDAQFDDARLAVSLAQTAAAHGASLVNYMRVINLEPHSQGGKSLLVVDSETGRDYRIHARSIINATGIFTDAICRLDNPRWESKIAYSQGIHLVLDRSFLPGDDAILIPRTEDGRLLFVIPWHDRVVLGTTDTPISDASLEPRPLPEEVDFLIQHANRYLAKAPQREEVRAVFAGIRPLFKAGGAGKKTSALARDHVVLTSDTGLVTIAGGKWTTYRKMAEDTVNAAVKVAELRSLPCITATLQLHGTDATSQRKDVGSSTSLSLEQSYGTDSAAINEIIRREPELGERLHSSLHCRRADVIWATRFEMARTVEDVLARRTRSLLLDAQASSDIAPHVATLMAHELGLGGVWEREQVAEFRKLASQYLLDKTCR